MIKKTICLLALSILCTASQAEVETILHYNLGKSGNITYAAAPEEIPPVTGAESLISVGKPVFFADAPENKRKLGEGGILFDGKQDGYRLDHALGTPTQNQLLEVWVKPGNIEKRKELQFIVANGNGKHGHVLAQDGAQWVLLSGGVEVVKIGKVDENKWTHLALSVEKGSGTTWLNGKKMNSFRITQKFDPCFTVAISDEGKEAFNGEIHEIRYSTFKDGAFNPDTDFLLDYSKINEEKKIELEKRLALIQQIHQPGLGKEIVNSFSNIRQEQDWLIDPPGTPCLLQILKSDNPASTLFQINNGLVSRTFYVGKNLACVGFENLSNKAEYLRAVKPEARIRIDGVWYEVGGLKNQPEYSYLLESWYSNLNASPDAFTLAGIETAAPSPRYPWKQKFNAQPANWPPKGLRIIMTYNPPESITALKDLTVKVNYEIYEDIPVLAKWIEIQNQGDNSMILDEIETEILAINQDQIKRIHVESDYSFALVNADIRGSALMHYANVPEKYHAGGSTTQWRVDSEYNTWATHNQAEDKFLDFPHRNLLISTLPMGPSVKLDRQTPFKSYVTFELLQDSDDRERQSLGHRRMYRKLAPQVTESLISGGISTQDETRLKTFIEQMAELGLEQLDVMAWPGITHDNLDPDYVQHWKNIASFAKERNIVIGGYELQIASRSRGKEVDCINPKTGKPGSLFGQSVCIASEWKDTYYPKMWNFIDQTGIMTYNMDGPYHGDVCSSTLHPHHRGLEDSQWEQWKTQVGVLHELQRRGMYIPIPDWYFLNGQCSTGMGYREASANLSPQQQMLLGRQYIYDGTWHKIPTMGWMTLQLVGFYTNDPRVGLEPLCENLDRYEQQLIQYLASGCKLTIRGNRLYDTPETKQMVSKWIRWFKQYRDILTSEIIHVGRPTGRGLDCIMHVNPFISHKGMVIVFNPTERTISEQMRLPLYYTGLKEKATVTSEEGQSQTYTLEKDSLLLLPVSIKPQSAAWFLIQ